MHIPILQKEVLQYLEPKTNENFIDATIGEGGHALAIAERILPNGKILGIDWSPEQIKNLESRIKTTTHPPPSRFLGGPHQELKRNLILVCDNFVNLKEVVKRERFRPISGILFDLGLSNWHLEESGRGFSFLRNEPLDMRYNPQNPLSAEKIVNYWSVLEIEKILKEYGQEQFAKKIAKEIIEARKIKPIKTTIQLVEIVKRATPRWYHHRKTHPATKTFQSLRIAVNGELNNLEKTLPQALEILKPGGKLVVISFHSLEDRIVKNFFKKYSCEATGYKVPSRATPIDSLEVGHLSCKERGPCLEILNKKPIRPSQKEIKINPRSRSAKLRTCLKL